MLGRVKIILKLIGSESLAETRPRTAEMSLYMLQNKLITIVTIKTNDRVFNLYLLLGSLF